MFKVGDKVCFYDKWDWSNVGEVFDMRTHGSRTGHSYYVKNVEVKLLLQPHKRVRIVKMWALRILRELGTVHQGVRFSCYRAG